MDEQKKRPDANTIIIAATVIIAALIVGGSIWTNSNKTDGTAVAGNTNGSGLEIGDSPVLGDPAAPNTIVEFLDFQCPVCERFFSTIEPVLREKYIDTGKAKLVYKTLTFIDSYDNNAPPLESLSAARAAECAKEQGKFVAMHDLIYIEEGREAQTGVSPENSGNLTGQFFTSAAQTLELDGQAFEACVGSGRADAATKAYMNDADIAMGGKVATPAVFVNGVSVSNPFDAAAYEGLIK